MLEDLLCLERAVELADAGMVAADVILRPGTAFLVEAERRGAVAHSGEAMLTSQIELLLDWLLWQDPLA